MTTKEILKRYGERARAPQTIISSPPPPKFQQSSPQLSSSPSGSPFHQRQQSQQAAPHLPLQSSPNKNKDSNLTPQQSNKIVSPSNNTSGNTITSGLAQFPDQTYPAFHVNSAYPSPASPRPNQFFSMTPPATRQTFASSVDNTLTAQEDNNNHHNSNGNSNNNNTVRQVVGGITSPTSSPRIDDKSSTSPQTLIIGNGGNVVNQQQGGLVDRSRQGVGVT